MNPTYKLARSARRDLQEISDYWTSEVGEAVALRIVGGIVETIVTMSRHPLAGVPADQFGVAVRKFPTGGYMVYYRPHAKGIEIVHVFHGARDQKKAWKSLMPKSNPQ